MENQKFQEYNKSNILSRKSTFNIKILYYHNTSWQGEIQWLEGCQTKNFRSFLEMVKLLQQASEKGHELRREKLRSWDD